MTHPDYRQTTIYINKQIEKKMKAAFLEDGIEDFSQWVEERIEEFALLTKDYTRLFNLLRPLLRSNHSLKM